VIRGDTEERISKARADDPGKDPKACVARALDRTANGQKKRPPAGSLIREVSCAEKRFDIERVCGLPYGSTNCVRFKGLEYLRLSPFKGTPSKVTSVLWTSFSISTPPMQEKPTERTEGFPNASRRLL